MFMHAGTFFDSFVPFAGTVRDVTGTVPVPALP